MSPPEGARPGAPPMIRRAQVTSTLDLIHELAAQGAPVGTAVVAGEQLEGRGSQGRTWHSPPGGLWYSMLLSGGPPEEPLSLRVGIAVARLLEQLAPGIRIRLKWPNDLMLDDRKLGGILCEARWHGGTVAWIAMGLGLNVANPIPAAVARSAIALNQRVPGIEPDTLVEPLTRTLRALDRRRPRLTPDELSAFQARDWLAGRTIREPVPGVAHGVDPDGCLLVRCGQGLERGRSGTVVLA